MAPKLPTTKVMLDQALQEFPQNRSGFSLIAIKKAMEQKFNIDFTKRRYTILKNCILKMLEDGELKNKNGHGLIGKFNKVARRKKRNPNFLKSKSNEHEHANDLNLNFLPETPNAINDSDLQHATFAPLRKQLFHFTADSSDLDDSNQSPRSSLVYKRKLRKNKRGNKSQNGVTNSN